jgi:hypothetical protein
MIENIRRAPVRVGHEGSAKDIGRQLRVFAARQAVP